MKSETEKRRKWETERAGELGVSLRTCLLQYWPQCYKKTFMLLKFFLLINVKMPTIVGILTFMSRKNSILGLSEPENS